MRTEAQVCCIRHLNGSFPIVSCDLEALCPLIGGLVLQLQL